MGPSIAGCSILKGIRLARRITTWYAAQQHHAGSWEGLEGTSQHLWFLHSEPLPITPLRQQKWTAWWSRFGILPARLAPERSHKSMETDSNTILITTKIAGICEWKSNHFDQSQHQLQTSLGYAKRSQNQRPQRLYTLLRNLYEKVQEGQWVVEPSPKWLGKCMIMWHIDVEVKLGWICDMWESSLHWPEWELKLKPPSVNPSIFSTSVWQLLR